MVGEPEVSVVIPTRDRARRLGAALRALRRQTLSPERFEIVVVDDGSTDETPELVSDEAGPPGLRGLRLFGQGPAVARNAGWHEARAPLVAFTDDDCEPDRDWLRSLIEASKAAPGAILQGVTRPNPREAALLRRPFTRTRRIEKPSPWFATCNIAYPRQLLERLGGFDESFPEALGEDTDLGWRALEQGATAEFVPTAIVHHAVEELGAAGYLRHALRGADAVYAFRRHPGLRASTLRYGVVRNPALARLGLAAVGLTLARHHRAAMLLAVPYAKNVAGRWLSLDAGPLLVPYLISYDLVQAFTSLRGSLRHRTLVL